jgi:hypothetical protein
VSTRGEYLLVLVIEKHSGWLYIAVQLEGSSPRHARREHLARHQELCQNYESMQFCPKGIRCQRFHNWNIYDSLNDPPLVLDALVGMVSDLQQEVLHLRHNLDRVLKHLNVPDDHQSQRRVCEQAGRMAKRLRKQASHRIASQVGSSERSTMSRKVEEPWTPQQIPTDPSAPYHSQISYFSSVLIPLASMISPQQTYSKPQLPFPILSSTTPVLPGPSTPYYTHIAPLDPNQPSTSREHLIPHNQ